MYVCASIQTGLFACRIDTVPKRVDVRPLSLQQQMKHDLSLT